MRTTNRLILASLLVFFSWISPLQAEGDSARGKEKAAACAACHGPDGNSAAPLWPKLAGQSEKYLQKQLIDFKKGQPGGRFGPAMTPLMATYSQQDMEDLAAYYASLKTSIGSVAKEYLKPGELLYRGGNRDKEIPACIACHGPQGLGNNEAGFPRLSGQDVEYVIKQLKDYRQGIRTNSINGIMPTIAKRMSDEDIIAIAHYVNGLH